MSARPYLSATLALILHAGWSINVAASLSHVGAWTLLCCAILLGTHAAGLVTRRPLAWVFSVAFLAITGAGYAALGGVWVYQGFTFHGSDGWGGLAKLIIIPLGAVIVAAGLASMFLARALARARDELAVPVTGAVWSAALLGALFSLGELAWLVGHEYHYRLLPEQNACEGGKVLSCAELARKTKIFDANERRGFALHGCKLDHLDSCRELSRLLAPSHDAASEAVRAIAAQCDKGMNAQCKSLSAHLVAIGDVKGAATYLTSACERSPAMCSSSSETLQQAGEAELARQLLETGCEGLDARSCRGLLKLADLAPEVRERLEFRACLVGDSSDCRRAIQRDFRATCERLCALATATYPCLQCAREAARRREDDLARGWLETTCERGYQPACKELGRPAIRRESRRR
ncbi:MAG: hypothetical protein ACT4P9_17130 [Betaproteobacteria bacterium]